jgi:hypothetical protein
MTEIEKFRSKVNIAREMQNYVVLTANEAQAILDEIDGVPPAVEQQMRVA